MKLHSIKCYLSIVWTIKRICSIFKYIFSTYIFFIFHFFFRNNRLINILYLLQVPV